MGLLEHLNLNVYELINVPILFLLFYFKIIYPGYKFSLNTVLQLAQQKLLTKLKSYILYNLQ